MWEWVPDLTSKFPQPLKFEASGVSSNLCDGFQCFPLQKVVNASGKEQTGGGSSQQYEVSDTLEWQVKFGVMWIHEMKLFHWMSYSFGNLPQRCVGICPRRTKIFYTHSTISLSSPWSFSVKNLSNTGYEEGERIPNTMLPLRSTEWGENCTESCDPRLPCRSVQELEESGSTRLHIPARCAPVPASIPSHFSLSHKEQAWVFQCEQFSPGHWRHFRLTYWRHSRTFRGQPQPLEFPFYKSS